MAHDAPTALNTAQILHGDNITYLLNTVNDNHHSVIPVTTKTSAMLGLFYLLFYYDEAIQCYGYLAHLRGECRDILDSRQFNVGGRYAIVDTKPPLFERPGFHTGYSPSEKDSLFSL